jgi:exosortase/archaeosortase family protein
MIHPRKKKEKPKTKSLNSLGSRLSAEWQQKKPVVLFVAVFALLMAGFYWLYYSQFYIKHVDILVYTANAKVSNFFLRLFGQGTQSAGGSIWSPKFSLSVARGCDAMEGMALFAAALLAFPAGWKKKIAGLAAGILLLSSLNIVRIVSLYLTGAYYPKAFELMHVEVWQVIFILLSVGFWIFWLRWSFREAAHVES